MANRTASAERERVRGFGKLEDGLRQASDWYLWGPYVSERQWGTVREDYSDDGQAWSYLPHDHARSRAYRWSEDGLAGFCDIEQRLCLGLALWNGRDPILKERAFGLTGAEANHGEDVKEYWWYLDALPSHAWNRWRYHYPQAAFPYEDLRDVNARRGKLDPEYELMDTGAFAGDRYWIVEVRYAKADPHDVLMAVKVTNAGPDAATLHVLPSAWFRNTWSWDPGAAKPALEATGPASISVAHPFLGELEMLGGAGPDGADPRLLFCENETNDQRLYGVSPRTPWPKDGINDHVTRSAATVNPDGHGTKCAFWYRITVSAGATVELRLRLRPRVAASNPRAALGTEFDEVVATRQQEADEFYAELTPEAASADEARVMRQAFSGMLWSKQLYHYDVDRWLDGDPTQPRPPESRLWGRNARWRNFDAFDIMSMPDKWEYPWFAAWDLAFHCVALAHVDPAFAKYQLILLCREWFQHLKRVFTKLFDEGEFLSPYGLRSLSAYHREHPYELDVEGVRATIDYEPAESTTAMFGGNSNWRGPLWFPLNWLVISALERYHQFFGGELKVEYPTGSGHQLSLDAIAQDLRERLISIFLVGPDGRRPCFGWVERLQQDPAWKDNLVFNEYFPR